MNVEHVVIGLGCAAVAASVVAVILSLYSLRMIRDAVSDVREACDAARDAAANVPQAKPKGETPVVYKPKDHVCTWSRLHFTDSAEAAQVRLAVLTNSSDPALVLSENFARWTWPGKPPRVCSRCRAVHPVDAESLRERGWRQIPKSDALVAPNGTSPNPPIFNRLPNVAMV